jgi:hypothetical protein
VLHKLAQSWHRHVIIKAGIVVTVLGLSAGAVLAVSWPGADPLTVLPQGSEIVSGDPIAIVTKGGNTAIAWATSTSPAKIILSRVNAQGGWINDQIENPQSVWAPTIDYRDGELVAAWMRGPNRDTDNGVQALVQRDSGNATVHTVMNNLYSFSRTSPHLLVGETGTHLIFGAATHPEDFFNTDLYHVFRPATQSTWPAPTVAITRATVLRPGASGEISHPRMALDGSTLHVVWQQYQKRPDSRQIWYMRGTLNGNQVTWQTAQAQRISPTDQQNAVLPHIVRDASGTLHIIWTQLIGEGVVLPDEQHIYYKALGSSAPPMKLNDAPIYVNIDFPNWAAAKATVLNSTLCVTWHGYTATSQGAGYEDIKLRCSTDLGQSWKPLIQVSDTANQGSIFPVVALGDAGRIQVAWVEYRSPTTLASDVGIMAKPDPEAIYYRTGTLVEKVYLPLVMRRR